MARIVSIIQFTERAGSAIGSKGKGGKVLLRDAPFRRRRQDPAEPPSNLFRIFYLQLCNFYHEICSFHIEKCNFIYI